MSYKKKRKEKNQTNIYKIDKQRFNRSSLVNLNKNLKISLLNGQKLNYKSFEIYFEKFRGRRNRRSRNNRAKSYSSLEKKKSGKKRKRGEERGERIEDCFENLSRAIHLGRDEFRQGGHRLDRMSMSGVVNFIGHRASPIRAFSHRWTRAPWSETFSPRCYIKARGPGGHHETDPRYLGEYCTLR